MPFPKFAIRINNIGTKGESRKNITMEWSQTSAIEINAESLSNSCSFQGGWSCAEKHSSTIVFKIEMFQQNMTLLTDKKKFPGLLYITFNVTIETRFLYTQNSNPPPPMFTCCSLHTVFGPRAGILGHDWTSWTMRPPCSHPWYFAHDESSLFQVLRKKRIQSQFF